MVAIRWSLERVGWELLSATEIKDHNGDTLNLTEGSPAMLRQLYRQRWGQVQWAQTWEARSARALAKLELKEVPDMPDPTPLRQVIGSKSGQRLSKGEARTLLRVFMGNYPTMDRYTRWGVAGMSQACPNCAEQDSIWHRLWQCPGNSMARSKHLDRFVAAATEAGQGDAR